MEIFPFFMYFSTVPPVGGFCGRDAQFLVIDDICTWSFLSSPKQTPYAVAVNCGTAPTLPSTASVGKPRRVVLVLVSALMQTKFSPSFLVPSLSLCPPFCIYEE